MSVLHTVLHSQTKYFSILLYTSRFILLIMKSSFVHEYFFLHHLNTDSNIFLHNIRPPTSSTLTTWNYKFSFIISFSTYRHQLSLFTLIFTLNSLVTLSDSTRLVGQQQGHLSCKQLCGVGDDLTGALHVL